MTWADFYLICFIVGFVLSLFSVLSGSFHLHIPGLHHGLHVPHGSHVGHGGIGGRGSASLPFINFGTLTAFLAWFGGVGYLLTRYSTIWAFFALMFASAAGLIGACIVFFFVAKVLMAHDKDLDPADYEMVGTIGTITSPIRIGGTGEIVFAQQGTRHTCAARTEDGTPLAKGAEVVITRYEKGIAYVKLWEELTESASAESAAESK